MMMMTMHRDDDDNCDMIVNEANLKLDFNNCPCCPLLRLPLEYAVFLASAPDDVLVTPEASLATVILLLCLLI